MPTETIPAPDTPNRSGRAPTGEALVFTRKVLIAIGIGVFVALLLVLVWYAADLLMLVFAGVLVSILLRRSSGLVRRATGLGDNLALALVVLVLGGVIAAFAWLVTDRIAT